MLMRDIVMKGRLKAGGAVVGTDCGAMGIGEFGTAFLFLR